MSLKEKVWAVLGGLILLAAFLLIRDSAARAAIAAFVRRKKTEDLAQKIKDSITSINKDIELTDEQIKRAAEEHRAEKLSEDPEDIKNYYRTLLTPKKQPPDA